MSIPAKSQWTATASSGDARLAIDDSYASQWVATVGLHHWLQIDLGSVAIVGGIEVYWGRQAAWMHGFECSVDGKNWLHLCATQHGEGGLNVFAFPPTTFRFLRWSEILTEAAQAREMVQINVYAPEDAAQVREPHRVAVLGHAPVAVPVGESVTVDFGYQRSPLGVLVRWGEPHGTRFSVHLSDDGEAFREVGRIDGSNGDYDSFWWRSTQGRFLRFTIHEAGDADVAIIEEMKLRILNKDRMPIGRLERAALAGRDELYPQALLGRQVYWTVLGEVGHAEEALFDEYGNLEPRQGFGQLCPLLRLNGQLHGVPGAPQVTQTLADGALPIAQVSWRCGSLDVTATALAHAGQAWVQYRLVNNGGQSCRGELVLAVRPVQINPYWQHGGHARIGSIEWRGSTLIVNGDAYAAFSCAPDAVSLADFEAGDVVSRVESGPLASSASLHSDSGLLSAALEFGFALAAGETTQFVVAAPLRAGVEPNAGADFAILRELVARGWQTKLGPRRIQVGDTEVSDTVAAQTGLILLNATEFALKPGPRNYDRTWIRDGSSQALALLYAGLIDEAKTYVKWYAERIYPDGMVPPILNKDGTINKGYGSDIEFDAQGQFVCIAAETWRITRDRTFLEAVFEPVVRAARFVDVLCARTNAQHGPETRYHGLVAPSISHEGYSKPTFSYWDDFFALKAWRDCAELAVAMGAAEIAAEASAKAAAFAANLARSIRMTGEAMKRGTIPASADREDYDPTSTSIAFEPCRVEDVLPAEWLKGTYDQYRQHLDSNRSPEFKAGFTPYEIRNLNAFVSLGRYDDACQMLADALAWRRPPGWRHWAEVIWADKRAPEYIGDMPHTWIGAEFATAIRRILLRENGTTLELLRAVPDNWWDGEGIRLTELPTAFGVANLVARRSGKQVCLDLRLDGPLPELVTIRYPGARSALADGTACEIVGDVIRTEGFRRLVVEI